MYFCVFSIFFCCRNEISGARVIILDEKPSMREIDFRLLLHLRETAALQKNLRKSDLHKNDFEILRYFASNQNTSYNCEMLF